jgi:hypothetical protein
VQKLNDEFQRRFFVIVNDDLEVAGLGMNIAHWKLPLIRLASSGLWRRG